VVTATTAQPVLRYQRDRTLDEVPALTSGIQLRLAGGERVYIALSQTELELYFDTPDHVLHYDLEGRLTVISEPNCYRRRSLSHRVLSTRKRGAEEGGGIQRAAYPSEAADLMVSEAHAQTAGVHDQLQSGTADIEFAKPSAPGALKEIAPLLERAGSFDAEAARRDADRFRQVYGRVAVLPPDQYNALVLQVTEGCAYSGCLFCELYRGVFFGRKTPAQFRQRLRDAVAYHGAGLRARRSIFLGEANALTLPHPDLREVFGVLHEHFELPAPEQEHVPASWWIGSPTRFDGVSSFLDVFTGIQRSVDEFRELRGLGLRRVYIGMESGDDALLRWLCKPATADRIATGVRTLKDAGIAVGVIALVGAGGREFAEAHVRETARLLNELPLGKEDLIYLSPLVISPGSRYAEHSAALSIRHLTGDEIRQQEQAIRSALRFDSRRGRPHLARYELETFVY
jgi:radical SAM superfamily enzyme YgiQ (UPF0313 family)